MSRAAKLTLGSAIIVTSFTIWGVHYLQQKERMIMHINIEREEQQGREIDEQQRLRWEKNREELEQQIALQREYENIQPVAYKDDD
ncbi:3690_t:CDS:2 [Paraglomus occultum]|uniref:3690_t:CDS:1 n=1 Tax=Paraglomus occultum TaxID=144539 RepID=A0A9N9A8D8_9GLOM|nr:3690_t:CDS:2 [Paraglomus occultum]